MIALVVSGLQPIHVAAFTAASLVVLSGALTMPEAYRAIEWKAPSEPCRGALCRRSIDLGEEQIAIETAAHRRGAPIGSTRREEFRGDRLRPRRLDCRSPGRSM